MSTRHLVDPEILPLIDIMPAGEFTTAALPQIRTDSEARFAFLPPPPLAAAIKVIAGPGGPLEVYWYDPAPGTANRPALLHIHGGGMVMG
ncbi:MAG: hypothetical protein RLZZ84_2164, partial [Pseudomonadota bacterium]